MKNKILILLLTSLLSIPTNITNIEDNNLKYINEGSNIIMTTEGHQFNTYENVKTIEFDKNTFIVYYNNKIICSNGYKHKLNNIGIIDEVYSWLYIEAELIEQPTGSDSDLYEKPYAKIMAIKNGEIINLNSSDAEFLYCYKNGDLRKFKAKPSQDGKDYWALCNISSSVIGSINNIIEIYIYCE